MTTPTGTALLAQREREARKTLMDAVDLDTTDCPHCVNGIAALDAYRAAVRAALVEEIVAKVEDIRGEMHTRAAVQFTHPSQQTKDALAALDALAEGIIDTIRGLAAPTTEEG